MSLPDRAKAVAKALFDRFGEDWDQPINNFGRILISIAVAMESIPDRDPILVAKRFETLLPDPGEDARFDIGVGVGLVMALLTEPA